MCDSVKLLVTPDRLGNQTTVAKCLHASHAYVIRALFMGYWTSTAMARCIIDRMHHLPSNQKVTCWNNAMLLKCNNFRIDNFYIHCSQSLLLLFRVIQGLFKKLRLKKYVEYVKFWKRTVLAKIRVTLDSLFKLSKIQLIWSVLWSSSYIFQLVRLIATIFTSVLKKP